MKVSLLTDASKHNLALMKISTYHKKRGDEVRLNMPLWNAFLSYGSWLFDGSPKENSDKTGGIGYNPQICLPQEIEKCKPDYLLFGMTDRSLGYTYRDCKRKCKFCKVPLLPKEEKHHSIWEFHNKQFNYIELLNNNTFYDPLWEETFTEIDRANLGIWGHGMDIRLLDEHKCWWIKRLRWVSTPKFAWDQMKDEKKILSGMKLLQKYKIDAMIYVLMGFDTTPKEDLYRCEIINSMGFDPFPMLYKETPALRKFRRFIYLRYYRSYPTIEKAWNSYNRKTE